MSTGSAKTHLFRGRKALAGWLGADADKTSGEVN